MVMKGFLCEICKSFWTEEEKATECEESHEFMRFEPVAGVGDQFPLAIRAIEYLKGKEHREAWYEMSGEITPIEEQEEIDNDDLES